MWGQAYWHGFCKFFLLSGLQEKRPEQREVEGKVIVYYWGVGQISPMPPNSGHYLSKILSFPESLRDWSIFYKNIKYVIRNAWGWSESEIESIKHERLMEIYDEAKQYVKEREERFEQLNAKLGSFSKLFL